ncbi:MAG: BrnT family toxin [Halobacteriovoraceae bacterium]|nr:BrnT family toxin [Halobacteriovoraceae bacterium]
MAQFLFDKWLVNWLWGGNYPFIFEWDKRNKLKNKEKRYGIIGSTSKEKVLQIVFTIRNGRLRVISARPAHKKEREQYEKYEKNVRPKT